MQSLPQFIAAALIKGTLRHFSRLNADYLEHQMSNDTNNFSVPSVVPVTIKQTDYKNLKTGEDFRTQANDVVMPAQSPVRSTDTSDELEVVGA